MGVDKLADHPNQVDKSPYAYAWNNPVALTDPDGNCPWCVVWALAEIGLAIYDAYDAGSTLIDPNASNGQKAMAAGGFLIGAVLPGGGYGTASKKGLKIVDNYADDVVKKALKETGSAKKAAKLDMILESGGSGRGTHNPKIKAAIEKGQKEHSKFAKKIKQKPGWSSEKSIPGTNNKLRPDATTPSGNLVELKPNTKSGRTKGKKQIEKYKKASGKNGKVIYYN